MADLAIVYPPDGNAGKSAHGNLTGAAGEEDAERCQGGFGIGRQTEPAAVAPQYLADKHQAESLASGLGGIEGGEQPGISPGRDAGTVVGNLHHRGAILRRAAYAQYNFTAMAFSDALGGVFHQIDEHLLQQDRVGGHLRLRTGKFRPYGYAAAACQ